MNRNKRAQIAQETVDIVKRGWYEVEEVGRVDIDAQVRSCLSGTTLYSPHDLDLLELETSFGVRDTKFEVCNETTLSAARRLILEKGEVNTLVLNFASAKNPGGGFLGGSQAQEESLARSSALYASLQTQPGYYEANRRCRTGLYTDHIIHSPQVPVFRDDDNILLSEPYVVGMITSPAVNAGAVISNEPANLPKILPTMASRIAKVLAVAAGRGYQHLVLGAWGCGVFRNDPVAIANLFSQALHRNGRYENVFESVTFAVLDRTADELIIEPFREQFSGVTR